MSTEIKATKVQNLLMQSFYSEWKLNNFFSQSTNIIRTPPFSPLANIDVQFCFDVWHQKIEKHHNSFSVKLTLMKLLGSDIPKGLKMNFEVIVNHSDGTLFKDYKSPALIDVNGVASIVCIDVITSLVNPSNPQLNLQKNPLTVRCHMTFMGHLPAPKEFCNSMRSFENMKHFAKDFRSIYEPSILSDIGIRIGSKVFPAHKSVLVAHSPIFLKAIESGVSKDKQPTIDIPDCNADVFERFLKYFYSGEIEDTPWPTVKELYILAVKYEVQTLKNDCVEAIKCYLNAEKCCEILKFAYIYKDEVLKHAAKKFAVSNFRQLVSTKEWATLVNSHPLIGYEIIACVHSVPVNTTI